MCSASAANTNCNTKNRRLQTTSEADITRTIISITNLINSHNVIYSVYTQLYISIVKFIYIHTQITLWQHVSTVRHHQANKEHF